LVYTRTDQNPWLAIQGAGGQSESDGVFYLLPYWMGRYHGYIAAPHRTDTQSGSLPHAR
jgi:hypothetical protein